MGRDEGKRPSSGICAKGLRTQLGKTAARRLLRGYLHHGPKADAVGPVDARCVQR